jgi:hypothetical protein
MSELVKVAKADKPSVYIGVVEAEHAEKFFQKHQGKYVRLVEKETAKKPEPKPEPEPEVAVEPSFIRRKPKASDE